jgi:ABC-2 type transport system permease protein
MPVFFQHVSRVVPTRYYFVIIRGIMLRGAGWRELWDQAAALLIIGTVLFALSVFRFRKKLD